jgi:hypothetical protein
MKASEVFDACHGRYRSLHEWLEESTGKVRAVNLESPSSGYQWRSARSRACEFVADFERIGKQAMKRPQWKGRLKLFEIYFLHSLEYLEAIKLVGVAEGTFDYWLQEVKHSVGRELSRCKLFRPRNTFRHENQTYGRGVSTQQGRCVASSPGKNGGSVKFRR